MYDFMVLFEHKDKFIIKLKQDGEIAHLVKNQHTPDLKPKTWAKILIEPSDTSEQGKKIFELTAADQIQFSKSKSQNPSAQPEQPEAEKKTRTPLKNVFMVPVGRAGEFIVGSFFEYKKRIVKITRIGREFAFEPKENSKSKLQAGELVCYIHYDEAEPTPDEFFNAFKDYYSALDFIKSNGVKPRHKPAEIMEIKKAKVLCDSRDKIDGCSWVAFNEEYTWYINHKTSPISLDNNIKINGEFAQCWRIQTSRLGDHLNTLKNSDIVVFKSGMLPMANPDISDDDLIL